MATATRRRSTAPTPRGTPGGFQTKTSKVTATMVTVTPEMAAAWLEKNTHNRPLRNRAVEHLTGVIQRDEWMLNGDAIRFDYNDVLQDGQHRLWAVVESGLPIDTMVVTGLPPEAQETMDYAGAGRRSLKDALQLRGEAQAAKLAAVVTYWWRYENNWVRHINMKPTVAQAMESLSMNPGLRESLKVAQRMNRFGVSLGVLATCHYEFGLIDKEAADDFFEQLIVGLNLQEGSPIFALRRYLEQHTASTGLGTRTSSLTKHALFIKAWNAYREGLLIDRLSWKATGLRSEDFPVPF